MIDFFSFRATLEFPVRYLLNKKSFSRDNTETTGKAKTDLNNRATFEGIKPPSAQSRL